MKPSMRSYAPLLQIPWAADQKPLLLPNHATMTDQGEKVAASILANRSRRISLIYGDLHTPPPPQNRLRPPEHLGAAEDDGATPDLAEKIRRLPPGIDARRHIGPNPRPTTTTIYSGASSFPTPAGYSGGEGIGAARRERNTYQLL
jgi:hypothetical protein